MIQFNKFSGISGSVRRFPGGAGTQTAGLAFGGIAGAAALNATEEYDGTSWTAGGNLGTARYQVGGAGTQTAGLCFAGLDDLGTEYANTEEYNGTSWTAGLSMATARNGLAGAGIQTSALGFGGSPGTAVTAATEEYSFSSVINVPAAWASGGNMATARYNLNGCGTQTVGLAFGGNTGSRTAATEEYNGSAWTGGGNMGTARDQLGGAGLGFGGKTKSCCLSSR